MIQLKPLRNADGYEFSGRYPLTDVSIAVQRLGKNHRHGKTVLLS